MQQEETKLGTFEKKGKGNWYRKMAGLPERGRKNDEFAKAGKPPDSSFYCCRVPGLQGVSSYP